MAEWNYKEKREKDMENRVFGKTKDGKTVTCYTLKNKNGMEVDVLNYGGIIVRISVPDAQGKYADVALGYDNMEQYIENPCFFGAAIGPNANRIGNATCVIDGKEVKLSVNDGVNNLHSHNELGYHARVFAVEEQANALRLTLEDEDGCMGFPGNKKIAITYTLTDNNELELHYEAESDANTILNLTNHSYFNLKGHGEGTIEDHTVYLKASHYTPCVPGSIPTGEIAPVKGTVMDFTSPKVVGKEIDADDAQLQMAGGYDHNWVLDDFDGQLQHVATVTAAGTTRVMKVYTTLPGIQFYAGNYISEQPGKEGKTYVRRGGLALETQLFPDSINKENFPNAVFGPERKYVSTTVYAFANA